MLTRHTLFVSSLLDIFSYKHQQELGSRWVQAVDLKNYKANSD